MDSYGIGPRALSPVVRNLLIANAIVFVLMLFRTSGAYVGYYGELVPSLAFAHGQVWRLVTYMFIHAQPLHFAFNMLALWMFGVELEYLWGSRKFAWFYFLSGIAAGAFSAIMWNMAIIGASGALLALLTMYAYHFPNRSVLLFFIFPVPVRWAVAFIGLLSLAFSLSNAGGIAHITHLGGIAVALLYIRLSAPLEAWYRSRGVRRREIGIRTRVEESARRERLFRETIDPILSKVAKGGMDSLTPGEKKLLFDASRKNRARFSQERIIPFDFK